MKKVTFLLFLFLLAASKFEAQVPVLLEEGYHLIDYEGDTATKYPYDYIHPRSGSTYLVIQNGEFNYINPYTYKRISERGFHTAYPFIGKYGLVGRTPHYHYISEKGLLFDTLDFALQPQVYGEFLVYGDSLRKVVDTDGKVYHRSLNPLFVAAKVGIFEWDKKERRVIQYYASYGSFRELKRFEEVDTLAFNHQGYAFIEQGGKFCVPSNHGDPYFKDQEVLSSYYLGLQIMWGKYLFLNRIEDHGEHFENEISSFPIVNASHCLFNNYPNRHGPSVELAEPYRSISMARIPASEKWVQYDALARRVEGRYLFDEVLPSDHKHLRLVRLGMTWFLYSERTEELQELPWRNIHPFGLQEERFFATNSTAEFWKRAWAYQNLDSLNGGPEQYYFIPPPTSKRLWRPNRETILSLNNIHKVYDAKDTIWLNQYGHRVAVEFGPELRPHGPLDYIFPKLEMSRKDIKAMNSRRGYKRSRLKAYLKEMEDGSYLMEIANTTTDTVFFKYENAKVSIQLEYKMNDSLWRPISYSPPSFNNYADHIGLAPRHKFSREYRPAPGNFLVWVRLRVIRENGEDLLSEPVRMKIPGGQLLGHRLPPVYALGAYGLLESAFNQLN
jgi:hypothetical protein